MKKECIPILLPTKDNSPISVPFFRMNQKDRLVGHSAGGEFRKYIQLGFKPQHLYIYSNEEPKDGDWMYNPLRGDWDLIARADAKFLRGGGKHGAMKVIATTDIKMYKSEYNNTVAWVAIIPQSFIQYYIEMYNKGEKIEKCMVEYEPIGLPEYGYGVPKLNGNEIIISNCEERVFTERQLLDFFLDHTTYIEKDAKELFKEWIKTH